VAAQGEAGSAAVVVVAAAVAVVAAAVAAVAAAVAAVAVADEVGRVPRWFRISPSQRISVENLWHKGSSLC